MQSLREVEVPTQTVARYIGARMNSELSTFVCGKRYWGSKKFWLEQPVSVARITSSTLVFNQTHKFFES
ncbi:U11/U12 small nuclear ribonucleoprotein 65 kDa protein [Pyrus ussuriensis x Pyrus communis]|uniref:U11/U12 small nuclear ribonucleoprotein 65 kDa protein n=1 Tax=Pyrus ussuriensis x Pyrus communis TaxID=2448454 RepID=A0A5N5GH21_9ROSA|nr:U11/U12 small nuclear ribonucleoprotein 65 kDa protein [Pyrus ussuriensis x Pyrus communis]